MFKRVFKEPITYFVIFGFLMYYFYVPEITDEHITATKIELTKDFIEGQKVIFQQRFDRQPTNAELESLIQEAVDEEILFREGWRMQLYVGDEVVRKRMIQKARFVYDDSNSNNTVDARQNNNLPNDFSAEFKDEYSFSFEHINFKDINKAQAYIKVKQQSKTSGSVGEPDGAVSFSLGNSFTNISSVKLEEIFGAGFSKDINMALADQWQGPIKSIYGYHAVRLRNIKQQKIKKESYNKLPDTAKVSNATSSANLNKALEKIKSRYSIVRSE